MYAFDRFGLDFGSCNVLELVVEAMLADVHATYTASVMFHNCLPYSRSSYNSSSDYSIAKQLNSIQWDEMISVAQTMAFSIQLLHLSVSPFGLCAYCMHTFVAL